MPTVLILGATGYIGLALSQALLRSGAFTVYGTARSDEKAKTLLLNEITPLQNPDILKPEVLASVIAKHRFDLVIDVTSAYEDATAILQGVVQAAKQRREAYENENAVGPKLGFIYTCGTWIHGDSYDAEGLGDLVVPGTSLHGPKPAAAVAWRPAHEQAVLKARDELDLAVVRPGQIYGRGSWIFTEWWKPILDASRDPAGAATVKIPANADARSGVVHVDDLAEAVVAVAQKIHGGLGNWPVIDIGAEFITIQESTDAVKKAFDVAAPTEFVGTGGNVFLDAMSLRMEYDTSRARYLLGWEPKRTNFVKDVKGVVAAWRATNF